MVGLVIACIIIVALIIFGAMTKKDEMAANSEIEALNKKLEVASDTIGSVELLALSSTDAVIAQLLKHHAKKLTAQQLEIVKIYYTGLKSILVKADDALEIVLSKLSDLKILKTECDRLVELPNYGDALADVVRDNMFSPSQERSYKICTWKDEKGQSHDDKFPATYNPPSKYECKLETRTMGGVVPASMYNTDIVNAVLQLVKDMTYISQVACSEMAKNGYSADIAKKYIALFKQEYLRTKNYMVMYLNRPITKLATRQL